MDFRTALLKVNARGITNVPDAVDLADLVVEVSENSFHEGQQEARVVREPNHDTLVFATLGNPLTMDFLVESKKIQAIKEVRAFSGASLVGAKNAVEDDRVTLAASNLRRERSWWNEDSEEPPF